LSNVVTERMPGFSIERVSLSSPSLRPDAPPVRFVHLSDLHIARLRRRHGRLVECVNGWQPDFVCLTGDLVTRSPASWDVLGELGGRLQAKHGVFACPGNWEIKTGLRSEAMRRLGEECGVTFLINESRILRTAAGSLQLCGIDDLARGWPVWEDTLAADDGADYTILMAHAPIAARLLPQGAGVDLMLSGHTHGGQIRVPLVWKLFLPSCHGDLVDGLRTTDWGAVYVNRGFGAAPRLPLRFRCPSEAAFFTLAGE
jgi:predicted MPP superfamily phosphohydrolase